jgi:hypothetical protein
MDLPELRGLPDLDFKGVRVARVSKVKYRDGRVA